MTATVHLRTVKHHRDQAQAEIFAAHLAAERGDTIAAAAHQEQHDYHLDVACYHEAAALAALDAVDAASAPAGIEGLTDGPVHVAACNTPGDDAIAS